MNDITSLKKQYDELITQANEIKKKINELDVSKHRIKIRQSNNNEFNNCLNIYGKIVLNYNDISRWYNKVNPPQYFEVHVLQNNNNNTYNTLAFRLFHVDTPLGKNDIYVDGNNQLSFNKNITNFYIRKSWDTYYYYAQSQRPIIEYNDK